MEWGKLKEWNVSIFLYLGFKTALIRLYVTELPTGLCCFQIKKANPEAEFKDISTILGTKWKTVTAEEKKPYEEKYQAEKEAYLKVVGNEKRENEAMKLLEEEQKQRTAMELLEQYLQFKQEAEKETKKKK